MLISPLALWIGLFRPAQFPPEPIAFQLKRGREIYQKKKGIDRVLDEDRAVMGTWFDGRVHRAVEEAIYVSPAMVSRWLGYLSASEILDDGEVQQRWQQVREQLSGSANFVVRVAAYRKSDPLDFNWDRPSGGANLENLNFDFSFQDWSGQTVYLPSATHLLARLQARHVADVALATWLSVSEPLAPLRPEGTNEYEATFHLGDNRVDYYWVRMSIRPEMEYAAKFSLTIAAKRKVRIANFALVPASALGIPFVSETTAAYFPR